MRYRINSPKVIHQIFDAEVVIVNLETGNYYSVGGSGIEIWRLLEQTCLPVGSGDGQPPLQDFLGQLEREELIVREEGQAQTTSGRSSQLGTTPPATLEKFTEMRELLLTDPIHELDESGWPKPAPPEQK